MIKKIKPMKINCDCLGGKKYCNKMEVFNFGDGDFEINVREGGKKKWVGIYLSKENVVKLVKFLSK